MEEMNPLDALMLKTLDISDARPIVLQQKPEIVAVSLSSVTIGANTFPLSGIESILWRASTTGIDFKTSYGGMHLFNSQKSVQELQVFVGGRWHELVGRRKFSFHLGAFGPLSLDVKAAQMRNEAVYEHLRTATWKRRIARYEEQLRANGACKYGEVELAIDGSVKKGNQVIFPTKIVRERERPWVLLLKGDGLLESAHVDVSIDGDVFAEIFERARSGAYPCA